MQSIQGPSRVRSDEDAKTHLLEPVAHGVLQTFIFLDHENRAARGLAGRSFGSGSNYTATFQIPASFVNGIQ